MTPIEAPVLQALQSDFETLDAKRAPAWLVALRTSSMRRFIESGIPSSRNEAWLYSDTRDLVTTARRRAGPPRDAVKLPDVATSVVQAAPGPQIIVVNGRIDAEASTLAAPWLLTWDDALASHGPQLEAMLNDLAEKRGSSFVHLNAAFLEEAVVVVLPQKKSAEHPLHVVHIAAPDGSDAPTVVHPRLFILAEAGAEAELVETYVRWDGGPDFVNAVTEIAVGENARLRHVRMQMEGPAVQHVGSTAVQLERNAFYDGTSLTFGGRLSRHEIHAATVAEGAEAVLNGLSVLRDNEHADTHIIVDHEAPHGSSHQLYKGVLNNHARSAFTGRVIVHKDAQKIDATQANHNLLLAREAVAETRPQLEIYADDVQCAHGATVGALDEEALFYLQSRAVGREAARKLLIRAFAHEVVKRIHNEALRGAVHNFVEARLAVATPEAVAPESRAPEAATTAKDHAS